MPQNCPSGSPKTSGCERFLDMYWICTNQHWRNAYIYVRCTRYDVNWHQTFPHEQTLDSDSEKTGFKTETSEQTRLQWNYCMRWRGGGGNGWAEMAGGSRRPGMDGDTGRLMGYPGVVWHCAVWTAHQLEDPLENTEEAEIPRIKLYIASKTTLSCMGSLTASEQKTPADMLWVINCRRWCMKYKWGGELLPTTPQHKRRTPTVYRERERRQTEWKNTGRNRGALSLCEGVKDRLVWQDTGELKTSEPRRHRALRTPSLLILWYRNLLFPLFYCFN